MDTTVTVMACLAMLTEVTVAQELEFSHPEKLPDHLSGSMCPGPWLVVVSSNKTLKRVDSEARLSDLNPRLATYYLYNFGQNN